MASFNVSILFETPPAILINILNNAMQAGATLISIEAEQKSHVCLTINDNGHGIDAQQLSKIQQQQPLPSDNGWVWDWYWRKLF